MTPSMKFGGKQGSLPKGKPSSGRELPTRGQRYEPPPMKRSKAKTRLEAHQKPGGGDSHLLRVPGPSKRRK